MSENSEEAFQRIANQLNESGFDWVVLEVENSIKELEDARSQKSDKPHLDSSGKLKILLSALETLTKQLPAMTLELMEEGIPEAEWIDDRPSAVEEDDEGRKSELKKQRSLALEIRDVIPQETDE